MELDLRNDGRKRLDFRSFHVEVDVVPQAAGSARIRLGRTEVLVSIKTDIDRPDLDRPGHGNIVCSVDAASGAAAASAAGSGMTDMEDRQRSDKLAELSTMLTSILKDSGGLDLTQLCIVEGKHCWNIFVDALILDEDGNLMDTIILATRAALARTRLPGVTIEESGEETEIVLSDDPAKSKLIDYIPIPVTVTMSLIGNSIIADATIPEEVCSDASLIVAVDKNSNILFSKKMLSGFIESSNVLEMVHTAQRLAASILNTLDTELDRHMQC